MKKCLCLLAALLGVTSTISAQEVKFEEYDLSNGLHVVLHKENAAPVVTVGVMYQIGAKDEIEGRTGFAHFFEHLLFEGSENIGRGEFMKIIPANGGSFNANTSQDRTYYYETFPSNKLELGLWLESERMLHPVIDTVAVNTQNEVVKAVVTAARFITFARENLLQFFAEVCYLGGSAKPIHMTVVLENSGKRS